MWKIGNIEIKNQIVLAPMAGISNTAYRQIIKEMGAGLIYAEIEFNSVEKASKFNPPKWFYKDVTGIEKYKNTQLSICKNLKNVIEY